jgi:ubiquinone/menaquinone biosynthesis methyltransferase
MDVPYCHTWLAATMVGEGQRRCAQSDTIIGNSVPSLVESCPRIGNAMKEDAVENAFDLKAKDWIDQPDRKREYNVALFREVASKYDFVTKALSLGRDQSWKRALIAALPSVSEPTCLDLACGTGDITFALRQKYPDGQIEGLDISENMLAVAQRQNSFDNVHLRIGDMCQTDVDIQSIDIVTGGYALRNAPSLELVLDELLRILRPGGTAAFLDFSKPRNKVIQGIQHGVLTAWGGFWGLMLHRNPEVYAYIAKSLVSFPDRQSLREMLRSRGFVNIRAKSFYFGALELLVFDAPL